MRDKTGVAAMLFKPIPDQGGGPISRRVVGNDELEVLKGLRSNAVEALDYERGVVVADREDREQWLFGAHH